MDYVHSGGFWQRLIGLLPTDPLVGLFDRWADLPYLGYLNWFVPMSEIIYITGLWLGAIAVIWLWLIALRWLRAIR